MKSASAESDGTAAKRRQRIEQIKGQAMGLRDQAKSAFRDKPYLVPVAAGIGGLGVGLLLGSKLTRMVVLTAVRTLLSDTVTRELKRFVSERFATPDAAMLHSTAS